MTFVTKLAVGSIRFFQRQRPLWSMGHCIYMPTCSDYAVQAIEVHGLREGLRLAARRLGRCNPWYEGGFDAVPCLGHDERTLTPHVENPRGNLIYTCRKDGIKDGLL